MRLTIHIRQAKTVSSVSDSVQMCTVYAYALHRTLGAWDKCRRARAQYVGPLGSGHVLEAWIFELCYKAVGWKPGRLEGWHYR